MVSRSSSLYSIYCKMAIDLSKNRVIILIRWASQREGDTNSHIIFIDDGAFAKVRRRCEANFTPLSYTLKRASTRTVLHACLRRGCGRERC
jgi:hypothetical protein